MQNINIKIKQPCLFLITGVFFSPNYYFFVYHMIKKVVKYNSFGSGSIIRVLKGNACGKQGVILGKISRPQYSEH